MCGPSHPGRSLNGLRVEGRKEGGGGGRAEPRQLEFLRRKDRAEKRVPSLGLPRRATSRVQASLRLARFPRCRRGIAPLSLSSSLAPVRRGRSWSPAWLPPVELRVRESGRRRRRRGRRRQRVSEGVRKRKGRKQRTRSTVSPGLVGEEETTEEKRRRR